MQPQDEERIAAQLAKAMAMICIRNTTLENLHAKRVPATKTGDFSDVFVVDADGQHIPWAEVSRLDDDEMRDLMRQVVNRLYTFQLCFGEPEFQAFVDRRLEAARRWDEPVLDSSLPGASSSD